MKNKKSDPKLTVEELAAGQAVRVLALVFLRVGSDSAAGYALRRALGFSDRAGIKEAAKAFNVRPSFIKGMQRSLESQLGGLSFLAKHKRNRATPGDKAISA